MDDAIQCYVLQEVSDHLVTTYCMTVSLIMENYTHRCGCYLLKPKAEADNTILDLYNTSFNLNAEFYKCFVVE